MNQFEFKCHMYLLLQNPLDIGVVNNLVGLGGGGARDGAANQNEDNNAEAANDVEEEVEEEGADNGNNAAQGNVITSELLM